MVLYFEYKPINVNRTAENSYTKMYIFSGTLLVLTQFIDIFL